MEATQSTQALAIQNPESSEASVRHWYAAHVCSRHEKRVAQQLENSSLECFLPLYRSTHRWKDRRAIVSLPLFPGYVFARIQPADRLRVLTTPGVVRLVSFQGRPAPIPDEEIETLRNCFCRQATMEPHPYLAVGRRARIKSGPFAGMEGILLRRKGTFRLVLSVNLIARSVAVEVDALDVTAA